MFSNPPPPQPVQTHYHHQSLSATNTQAPAVSQLAESHSSNEAGSLSSDDGGNGTQNLNSSMAAMTLAGGAKAAGGGNEGIKLSDRARHIHRVREASGLGKLVSFAKPGMPGDEEEEDENDLIPLGGLRQMRSGGATPNGGTPQPATAGSFTPQQLRHQQPHGLGSPMRSAVAQPAYYQHLQTMTPMQSPLTAGPRPYAADPMGSMRGPMQWPTAYAAANGASTSHTSQPHLPLAAAHTAQQQMAYSQATLGSQSVQLAAASSGFRTPMTGNSSITFGGVGLARGSIGMQAPNKSMYAPSPLSSAPMYRQSAMDPSQMMTAAQDPSLYHRHPAVMPALAQMHMQQQQQAIPMDVQQAALMSYIPNRDRCGGSMAKNPLMRDMNKAKEFSAKDYGSRPTLLAEADSRRQAKKNMPGLGGTTCHSFQPEVQQQQPPPQPLQPSPSDAYHPRSPSRPHGRRHHHHGQNYDSPRGDAGHRTSSPRYHPDDPDHGYISSTSSVSRSRRHDGRDGRGRRGPRHARRDIYDHYDERPPPPEFRQRDPPRRRSRGRDPYRRRREEQDYDHYDYSDYSDSYISEYDDEWDYDSDDYYDDHGPDPRDMRRRPAHRRSRGDDPRGPARADDRRKKHFHERRNAMYEPRRKPRPARLDDPRDGGIFAAPARRGQREEGAPHPGMPAGAPDAQPRSQFGRMLANIKRHATLSKPSSPKSTEQGESAAEEDPPEFHSDDEAPVPSSKHSVRSVASSTSHIAPSVVEDAGPSPTPPSATVAVAS
ncbi:hypothetical protein GGF46_004766 [Coemansia sp. RSA 552]|nr:hypothetical protein GGF46_004766 [Coemansia sp. RSA 552]